MEAPPLDTSGIDRGEFTRSRSWHQSVPAQVRSLLLRIHFYAGIFVAPFILIAAATGASYALSPTLESIVYRDALTASETAPISLEDQVEAALAVHPDLEVVQIWPADAPGVTTRVLFNDPAVADDEQRVVFVDPGTGAVTGDLPSYSGLGELPLRRWISGMHQNLHMGTPGAIYSEIAASWLWLLALSGVFLWWRRVKARKSNAKTAATNGQAFTPRTSVEHVRRENLLRGVNAKKGTRMRALSLHATAGTWLLIVILGLSATGLTWSTFAGNNVDKVVAGMGWKASPIVTALPPEDGSSPAASAGHDDHFDHGPADAISQLRDSRVLDEMLVVYQAGRDAGLTGPLRLFPPADELTAWEVSELWVPWRLTSDAVTVDGADGRIVDRLDFADLPTFSKLSSWGIYLHMGILFGLPLQIALFLTGVTVIFLVIQGYRMWWKRRPHHGGVAGPLGSLSNLSWPVYTAAAAVSIAIGLFLPLLGISLLLFLIVDLAASARRRRQAAASEIRTRAA